MAAASADSLFFQLDDGGAFEFHSIKVKSLPENRRFNTIKMFTVSRELMYLRPEGLSIPEDHLLLLRGPKVAAFGEDEVGIVIGDNDWRWNAAFHPYNSPNFGIQTRLVKDPQFPEAAVEITFERISNPAQAHFNIEFKDIMNKERKIYITSGIIFSIANRDVRTKRVLRCFGDDLIQHMLPSEKLNHDPPELVSGDSIGLYRSQTVVSTKSDLIIFLDLVLEIVTCGARGVPQSTTFQFQRTASSTAPDEPKWLKRLGCTPLAMDETKETTILEIDDFAKIQVGISWFNDVCAVTNPSNDHTLWGYRDGDCDYQGYTWADRQEIDWDNLEEEPELEIPDW